VLWTQLHSPTGGASTRGAARQLLKAARSTASRMAAAGGASMWVAPSLLKATRGTAQRTEAASGACTRAAPSQLLQLARSTAERTEGEGFASKPCLPAGGLLEASRSSRAARSARYVCGAHSRSPTVRRRSNPQHTTWHSASANARRSRRWWRTSHNPVHG
jgi:hypothetical protein